jgi:hypothetical protein
VPDWVSGEFFETAFREAIGLSTVSQFVRQKGLYLKMASPRSSNKMRGATDLLDEKK